MKHKWIKTVCPEEEKQFTEFVEAALSGKRQRAVIYAGLIWPHAYRLVREDYAGALGYNIDGTRCSVNQSEAEPSVVNNNEL